MMTNKEKYPKTEDALAAFRKHKEECKCDCTFDLWLKMPCDEEVRSGKAMMMVGLAGLSLFNALSKGVFDGKDEESTGKESTGNSLNGIECPVCHKKNGKIGGLFIPIFKCPDCGAAISRKEIEDKDAFAKWLS